MKERKHKIDIPGTIHVAFRGLLKFLWKIIRWEFGA